MAMRSAFQYPVYFSPKVFYQAFPSHMSKALRIMQGLVQRCDCVIEVHDARVPLSGYNKTFDDIFAKKPRILILNKIDLADEEVSRKLIAQHVKNKDIKMTLVANCKTQYNQAIKRVLPMLKRMFHNQNVARALENDVPLKSLPERQHKVLVCGVPNVGKSSLINSIRRHFMHKGKAAPVGKKPGITRSVMQTITISRSPLIYILDTPGIVAPSIPNTETGMNLALTGTFPDHTIGEEVIADYLLYVLNKQNNQSYLDICGLTEPCDDFHQVIRSMAIKHNLIRQNRPHYLRCCNLLISSFRNGDFGRITLDDESDMII